MYMHTRTCGLFGVTEIITHVLGVANTTDGCGRPYHAKGTEGVSPDKPWLSYALYSSTLLFDQNWYLTEPARRYQVVQICMSTLYTYMYVAIYSVT